MAYISARPTKRQIQKLKEDARSGKNLINILYQRGAIFTIFLIKTDQYMLIEWVDYDSYSVVSVKQILHRLLEIQEFQRGDFISQKFHLQEHRQHTNIEINNWQS